MDPRDVEMVPLDRFSAGILNKAHLFTEERRADDAGRHLHKILISMPGSEYDHLGAALPLDRGLRPEGKLPYGMRNIVGGRPDRIRVL